MNSSEQSGIEQVLYVCGESRFDDGPGEAPNKCPTCGAPIDAVRTTFPESES